MTITENTATSPNGGAPAEAPTVRARLVSVTVQLNLVADDGATLDPIAVQPIQVRALEWASFRIEDQIADVQRQLDEGAAR